MKPSPQPKTGTPSPRPTLFAQALTASLLASRYIRINQKAQAQRKLRQALQALGQ